MTGRTGIGPYSLLHEIGRGARGRVYVARHRKSGEIAAIKVPEGDSASGLRELKREFRALRALSSPHLVPLQELIVERDHGGLVMPVVRGVALDAWARVTPFRSAPDRLFKVIEGLFAGVVSLHRAELVHRDIKPENVLVDADDTVTVIDYSGTTPPAARAGTDRGEVIGTLAYMAPEALLDTEPSVGHDLFALGAAVFETIAGLPPPRRSDDWTVPDSRMRCLLCEAWPEIPVALLELVSALLASRACDRPSSEQALEHVSALRHAPRARVAAAGLLELVGRARELSALGRALSAPSSRVAVTGASGMGKSALVEAALRELRASEPAPLLLSTCYHPGEHLSFVALDELVEGACDLLDESGSCIGEQVDASSLAVLARAFPAARALVDEHPLPTDIDLASCRELLPRAVARLLEALASQRRLLLWIDDVHWTDRDGEQLLAELLELLEHSAVGIVLSGRTLPASLAQRLTARLDLGPLDAADARALVLVRGRAARSTFGEQEITAWLIEGAAGNPGLLCRLADHAAASHSPCRSLPELVERELHALPASAVEVIAALSLLGHPMPMRAVCEISSPREHRATLHALACTGLVRPGLAFGHAGLMLSHDSLRDAVLDQVDGRARLHAKLARALEALESVPRAVVARQHECAGQTERAGALLLEAGEEALAGLAFEQAVDCFRRAYELVPGERKQHARTRLARALALSGRAREAGEHFLACARSTESEERSGLLRQAASQLFLLGENQRAIALVNELLAPHGLQLPASLSRTAVALLALRLRRRFSRPVSARSHEAREPDASICDLLYEVSAGVSHADLMLGAFVQELHLRHALRARSAPRIARALALEAGFSGAAGAKVRDTRKLLAEARRLLPLPDARARALIALCGATSAWAEGRWSRCIAHACEAEAIAERRFLGGWWELGLARSVLQDALRWSGRYRELATRTSRYIGDAEARGDRFAVATFRTRFEATLLLLADDPHGAFRTCDWARTWPSADVHLQHLAEVHSRTECLLYGGEPQRALSELESALARLRTAPLLRAVPPRAKLYHTLAACRLAVARQLPLHARAPLLAAARRDVRATERAGWGYTDLLADLITATSATLAGADARSQLHALQVRASRLDMPQYAAAIGLSTATSSGARARFLRTLRALGATDPLRFAAQLVPGLLSVPPLPSSSSSSAMRSGPP